MSRVPKADSAEDSSPQVLRRVDDEAVLRGSSSGLLNWLVILRFVDRLTAIKLQTIAAVYLYCLLLDISNIDKC